MKSLLDINVVLDVLLERQPFFKQSDEVWKACDDGRVEGYISATTLPTIFYIARKLHGLERARKSIELCLQAFDIAPVNGKILETAFQMAGRDFEDDLQIACAVSLGLDAICTRDSAGFVASPVPALSPELLLSRIISP
jgi:predicted nucleic acid-binding protein